MDEQVASALDATFPDREVEATEVMGPSWNEKNRTVRVEFADGERAYLKIAADGDGSRIARERAVIDYVGAHCEVPVPTVVAGDPDADVPYLATAPMAGERLLELWYHDDERDREALARQVGRALASVHSARFEDHGHIAGGGADGLELDPGSWTDVLVERIERMRAIAGPGRFDHHFEGVIAAVEDHRDLLDDAPAALVHGDPAHPNCVRSEAGIGFLDWEIAHVGDPARELRRARRVQIEPMLSEGPERLVAALREGYRDRAGSLPAGYDARKRVYDAVTFLGTSGFFDRWAPDADEPTGELEERVRSEMTARLAKLAE